MSLFPESQADEIFTSFDLSLPVDIKKVCNQLTSNSFKIKYEDTTLPTQICGMSIGNSTGVKLLVNTQITPKERHLFTGAHELGHALLHIQTGISSGFECSDIDLKSCENSEKKFELEANQFAAAFLMPRKVIQPIINRSDITWALIDEIAKLCQTSLEATARRIINITNEPYALIIHENQTMWTPIKSKKFPTYISPFVYPKKLLPSPNTTRNLSSVNLEKCLASDWGIESRKNNFDCYYSSIFFHEKKRIMTLLLLDEMDEEEVSEWEKPHF